MPQKNNTAESTKITQEYYNSSDADNFYHSIWGGEDIHIGLYENSESIDIFEASRNTVKYLSSKLNINDGDIFLDLGSGYGGATRYIASNYPVSAIAVNLSEKENERHRKLNEEANLSNRINVVYGNFEELQLDDQSVDLAWSQDAILHSGNRQQVLKEVHRVLKPGGQFIFTDPMRQDNVQVNQLGPILQRIHLQDLGSPKFYIENLEELGFNVKYEDKTNELITHYSRVLQQTEEKFEELSKNISIEYLENMKEGLNHWIEGGKNSLLAWGIFYCQKN